MFPTAFDEETGIIGPPPGMSESEVYSLSIAQASVDGHPAIVSCWKVTAEELAEIQRTGRVWLICMGGMPPVILSGHKPEFEKA
jgi:hypothetical protein